MLSSMRLCTAADVGNPWMQCRHLVRSGAPSNVRFCPMHQRMADHADTATDKHTRLTAWHPVKAVMRIHGRAAINPADRTPLAVVDCFTSPLPCFRFPSTATRTSSTAPPAPVSVFRPMSVAMDTPSAPSTAMSGSVSSRSGSGSGSSAGAGAGAGSAWAPPRDSLSSSSPVPQYDPAFDLTFYDPDGLGDAEFESWADFDVAPPSPTSRAPMHRPTPAYTHSDEDAEDEAVFTSIVMEANAADGMLVPFYKGDQELGKMVLSKRATVDEAMQEAVSAAREILGSRTNSAVIRPAGLQNWEPTLQPEITHKLYGVILMQMGLGDLFDNAL